MAAARLVVADKVVEVPTMEAAQAPQPEADQEVIGVKRDFMLRRCYVWDSDMLRQMSSPVLAS